VLIGRMWTRHRDGSWQTESPGPGQVGPQTLAQALRELAQYLVNPELSEDAASYRIAGALAMPREAVEAASLTRLLSGPEYAGTPTAPELRAAQVALTVDKGTGHLTQFTAEATWAVIYPRFSDLVEGVTDVYPVFEPPDAAIPTEQRVSTTLSITNINDPAIQIQPPR
jgi:hypothetical protein